LEIESDRRRAGFNKIEKRKKRLKMLGVDE